MKKIFLFLLVVISVSLNASTLYWVGGTGNWSDNTHWSTTSGGSSCLCVPTTADNVVFDVSSFTGNGQSVIINAQAYCKDMTWISGVARPALAGSSPLDIYGSLTLSQNMEVLYTGAINFKSNNGNSTITTAGKIIRSNLYFDGAGSWTLQDSLRTYNTGTSIELKQGDLNTNGKYIYAYQFKSDNSNGIKSLSLGNSTIVLTSTYYNPYAWQSTTSNMSFDAGTSRIILNGSSGSSFSGAGLTYYDVDFNNTIGTANLYGGNSTFHNVSFTGDGSISGSNTFNDLTFAQSKSYTLSGNTTQTIIGSFTSNGTCAIPAFIDGGNGTSHATLNKTSGSVTTNFVRMNNVYATGGATFTANNVTDFGNNNGWILNTAASQTLYWIGNGGNWTDAFHWSTISGGLSSGCIPTPYDNVVFDVSSFTGNGQSVIINAQAYCKDMTWISGVARPALAGSSPLDIYGSLTLSQNMEVLYTGAINFKSNNGNSTITTAGKIIRSNLYFDGAGSWTLQDSLRTYNTGTSIELKQGDLNTNGKYIYAYQFKSDNSNGIKSLSLGNSTIVLTSTYYNPYAWQSTTSNMSFDAGTSRIILNGSSGSSFSGAGLTYYDVDFNNTIGTANLYGGNSTFHNVSFTGDGSISGNNSFNNVSFAGNGTISGSNTFNNLALAPGKTYSFGSSATQTIIGNLYATGTQSSNVTIKSTSNGNDATISKGSGIVCLEYVTVKDITAIGGAQYFASVGSVDNGNNTGWSFAPCPSQVNTSRLDFITPNTGGNIGEVTVNVFGIFPSNSILKFTKTGESDIVFVDSLTANINTTRLRATTNLIGKGLGSWNVIVEVPGDTIMQLIGGFTIVIGVPPVIQTELIGSAAVRTNVWQTFSISYTNTGNVNATGVPIWLAFPSSAKIEILSALYDFPLFLGADTVSGVFAIDSLDGQPSTTDSLMGFLVTLIPPQGTGTINFRLKSTSSGSLDLFSWATKPLYASPLNPGIAACIDDVSSTIIGFIPGVGCAYDFLRLAIDPAISVALNNNNPEGILVDFGQSLAMTAIGCVPIAGTAGKIIEVAHNISSLVVSGADIYGSCSPFFQPNSKNQTHLQSVTSIDPNDKVGPIGAGSQAYHAINRSIPYQIRYENADSATAPVQVLTVIDSINGSMFDLSTFEFGFITIGDTSISVPPGQKSLIYDYLIQSVNILVRIEAEFNQQTGIVSWFFTSLDPITEQPVINPLSGFLPPNVNVPQGEGSVFFTIKPRATLNQNAVFANKAYIIFDNNSAIVTNTWSNTVDKIPPISDVTSLIPLQVDTNFPVSWSGSDVGSGLRHFSIYYSKNGGSFSPWLINTETTSGIFTGQRDTTYSFFSVAVDSAGNIETAPSSPDATTKVLLTGIALIEEVSNLQIFPNPNSGNFNLTIESNNVVKLEVSCLNLIGKKMYFKDYGSFNGSFKTELNLSNLAQGIYLLQVRANGKSIYRKVTITK